MEKLSHIDQQGNARMVDVSAKPVQIRTATASGRIILDSKTVEQIKHALNKKGDVLTTAELAGVQAAKRTAELIPLCHTLITDHIAVTATLESDCVVVASEIRCHGRTGAEMEALTAVSVALLTVYDMCKAVDKKMIISEISLTGKEKK